MSRILDPSCARVIDLYCSTQVHNPSLKRVIHILFFFLSQQRKRVVNYLKLKKISILSKKEVLFLSSFCLLLKLYPMIVTHKGKETKAKDDHPLPLVTNTRRREKASKQRRKINSFFFSHSEREKTTILEKCIQIRTCAQPSSKYHSE